MNPDLLFLKEHGAKYYGKWVALSRGMLLGVATRYADLFYPYRHCDGIIITRVLL